MQNYWNLYLACKQQQPYGPVNYRDFRETGPWPVISEKSGAPNEDIVQNPLT